MCVCVCTRACMCVRARTRPPSSKRNAQGRRRKDAHPRHFTKEMTRTRRPAPSARHGTALRARGLEARIRIIAWRGMRADAHQGGDEHVGNEEEHSDRFPGAVPAATPVGAMACIHMRRVRLYESVGMAWRAGSRQSPRMHRKPGKDSRQGLHDAAVVEHASRDAARPRVARANLL